MGKSNTGVREDCMKKDKKSCSADTPVRVSAAPELQADADKSVRATRAQAA